MKKLLNLIIIAVIFSANVQAQVQRDSSRGIEKVNKREKLISQDKPNKKEKKAEISASRDESRGTDTTLANTYSTKAKEFYNTNKYDSAIIYFEKASIIYEKREIWNKYLDSKKRYSRCYDRKRRI